MFYRLSHLHATLGRLFVIVGLMTHGDFHQDAQSFLLEDGRYSAKDFGAAGDHMRVSILDGCVIDLSEVFPE